MSIWNLAFEIAVAIRDEAYFEIGLDIATVLAPGIALVGGFTYTRQAAPAHMAACGAGQGVTPSDSKSIPIG
jgi:hypothetical protein